MGLHAGLRAHLGGGVTTVARAWAVTRKDGLRLGFTDHDRELVFDGLVFRVDTGLSALALQQGTGLSVDNTEALGALSDSAISEADIDAGRFDGAEVVAWLVNWADVDQRQVMFRGSIGDITRHGGAFQAELRGLTEALNRPVGRVFQAPCGAVLGDGACRFDMATPGYFWDGAVVATEGRRVLTLGALDQFDAGWFQRGRVRVLSGLAEGLHGTIKRDSWDGQSRTVELWTELRAEVVPGDLVRIEAGCDKRFDTCRLKFNNLLNFQGFPDIPEEDWMAIQPASSTETSGGSRR
ncbi:DUF2163 domain-containing protein [Mesobacterium sp. TK19101]|uniref:DUF2163 domain-containing protein n=1 Tax=Mesobacterium hydrothermale TaxID=3111907 RepID=A0ABU6HIR6_9RHOB|nr:DUF2163 domain-containing protein [Mesobacterium sp. TK19101]MEC3862226.1 DUF2163 domain-containing protein [Mesobacterium sp. TK19101]